MFAEHVHIFELLWLCIVIPFNAIQHTTRTVSKYSSRGVVVRRNIRHPCITSCPRSREENTLHFVPLHIWLVWPDVRCRVRTRSNAVQSLMCSQLINNYHFIFIPAWTLWTLPIYRIRFAAGKSVGTSSDSNAIRLFTSIEVHFKWKSMRTVAMRLVSSTTLQ